MKVFLISYDLKKPGRNYDDLYKKIKSFGKWYHCLESVWIIKTSSTLQKVSDELVNQIDDNDRLLVVEIKNNYSGWMPRKFWNWMRDLF